MIDGRWVGVGDQVEAVLRWAYQAPFRRGGSPAGTLDVLAHAVLRPSPPLFVPEPVRAALRDHLTGHRRPMYGPGEIDVVPPADPEVDAVLREVEWRVRRMAGRLTPVTPDDVEPWSRRPGWTPAMRVVVAGTLAEARARGVAFAGVSHLLLAMLRLRDCDGTRCLAHNDVRHADLVASVARDRSIDRAAAPHPEPDGFGMAAARGGRGLGARLSRVLTRLVRLDGPMVDTTGDTEAQAARLDHGVAGAGHALLAMLRTDECLVATGVSLPPRIRSRNQGAALLRAAGLDAYGVAAAVASAAPPPEPGPEALAAQAEKLRRGDPFVAEELTAAQKQAAEISLRHHHAATGTTHYLLALLDAPTTAPLFEIRGADPAALRAQTEAAVAAMTADWS